LINTPFVLIFIKNKKAQTYYKNKGYDSTIGTYLKYPVSALSPYAHTKVEAKCTICSNIIILTYSKYTQNCKRYGYYSCKKCSTEKRKTTCLQKYGVEYIAQTQKNRDRMQNFMKSDEFKAKSKETLLKKYGVEHYNKSEEAKINMQIVLNNRTDNEQKIINDKIKSTIIQRYGYEYLMQSDIFRNKAKKTMILKYGVEFPMQSAEIFNKAKKTALEKYGNIYVIASEEIKKKMHNTKVSKGLIMDYNKFNKTAYKKYRRSIYWHTLKHIDVIKESWDGYDFYDKIYIKDNYTLYDCRHKLYPTIDHKISIFSAFILNLPISDVVDIDNLCITTRSNNSKKSRLNYEEYLLILKNIKD